jgi:hypothetical protein
MPVSLTEMRYRSLIRLKVEGTAVKWDELFADTAQMAIMPTLPAVPLGPKAALAIGAAAAVVKNSEVTRRWFWGLWK